MRTRQNTEDIGHSTVSFGKHTLPFARYHSDGSVENLTNANPGSKDVIYQRDRSVMSDEVGRFHKSNPVVHVKRKTTSCGPGSWIYHGSTFDDLYGDDSPYFENVMYQFLTYGYWDFEVENQTYPPGWVIEPSSVSDERAVGDLKDAARAPVIQGLLDLVESPDLAKSYHSFSNWAGVKKSKWTSMRKYCSKLTRHAADKYLAAIFGIAPLISDIQAVRRYIKHLKSDFEKYKSGTTRRVAVKYYGDATFTADDGSLGLATQGGSNRLYKKSGEASQVVTRYVMLFTEKKPNYKSDIFSYLDFLLTRFGSEGPASFAWERIPFSFVVDWFLDVGGVVERLDNLIKSDPIVIKSVSKSIKWETTTTVGLLCENVASSNCPTIDQDLMKQHTSYYSRFPVTNYGPRPLLAVAPGYGKRQMLTSLALIRQLKR